MCEPGFVPLNQLADRKEGNIKSMRGDLSMQRFATVLLD